MLIEKISTSWHPSQKMLRVTMLLDQVTISFSLGEKDMAFFEAQFKGVRESFLPWIAANFHAISASVWACHTCNQVVNGTDENGGAIVLMWEHLRDVHGRSLDPATAPTDYRTGERCKV